MSLKGQGLDGSIQTGDNPKAAADCDDEGDEIPLTDASAARRARRKSALRTDT